MANKLAHYKDPEFIAFMREWFQYEFAGDFHKPNQAVHSVEVYQRYHEYTTKEKLYDKRVDYARFVKCLRASGDTRPACEELPRPYSLRAVRARYQDGEII